jgi:copper chaperone
MKEVLKVEGMSCGHCVSSVEGSVGKIAGVSAVQVKLDAGEVSVEFDQQLTTLDRIKEAIEDQGYEIL